MVELGFGNIDLGELARAVNTTLKGTFKSLRQGHHLLSNYHLLGLKILVSNVPPNIKITTFSWSRPDPSVFDRIQGKVETKWSKNVQL